MKNLLLIIVIVLILFTVNACGDGTAQTTSTSPTSSSIPVSSSVLSEQPDMATYQKYFSELGIGKMPAEIKNLSEDLQKNVNVFTANDEICLYGEAILECQIRSTIYDVVAGKVVREGGLPTSILGGFATWDVVNLPAGKYEYKIYVNNILVGVFPFEVH